MLLAFCKHMQQSGPADYVVTLTKGTYKKIVCPPQRFEQVQDKQMLKVSQTPILALIARFF